ncbi:MAG: hypothetical protein ACR2F8_05170 [Caulobacteraceae bacterium]
MLFNKRFWFILLPLGVPAYGTWMATTTKAGTPVQAAGPADPRSGGSSAAAPHMTVPAPPKMPACDALRRPADGQALLRNINVIFRCRLLAKSTFYASNNLERVFGGGAVTYFREPHGPGAQWQITHLASSQKFREYPNYPITITFDGVYSGSDGLGRNFLNAGMIYNKYLTALVVEEILGAPDKIVNKYAKEQYQRIIPIQKSVPLGNLTLVYLDKLVAGRSLEVLLYGDGTVDSVIISDRTRDIRP